MKKAIILLIIYFTVSSSYVLADNKKEITMYDIFPKSSEMEGGSSKWIISGVKEEKRGRCTVYTNTYTYYSDKGSVYMGITRKNTYIVSARIFNCDNFISAIDEYNSLLKSEEKIKKDKKSATAAFGEAGNLTAIPINNNTTFADFYLTYYLRNFVVQVYSDDGFAQMDMAGEIERRLRLYLARKGVNYYINKINLDIKHNDIKDSSDYVSFAGDNIAKVVIDGIVYDNNNKPVENAEITARETGHKTKTDKNGKYRLEVVAGQGKSISLKKIIFVNEVIPPSTIITTGLYELESSKNMILNILVTERSMAGKAYDIQNNQEYSVWGKVDREKFSFSLNCSQKDATFKCLRNYEGTLKDNIITGKWQGTGGSGSWKIDKTKFALVSEKPYLRDVGLSLYQYGNNKLKSPLTINNSSPLYLKLEAKPIDNLFFKEANLLLNIKENNSLSSSSIVLYNVSSSDKSQLKLRKITSLATLPKGKTGIIQLDISSQLRLPNKNGYIIGIESSNNAEIIFDNNPEINLTYYRDIKNYKPIETVSIKVDTFNGDDIVGNTGIIKQDGNKDIVLEAVFNYENRNIEFIEIIADGDIVRRWNTNPYDIYPVAAIIENNEVLNNNDGSINIKLSSTQSKLKIHLYGGSIRKNSIKSFKIKAVIDGKIYENIIENN